MADQPKLLEVCTDTCVLINLAHVSRLDLLGQLQDMVFHAPQEVLNEVTDPGQMRKVEAAMENGALRSFKIAAVEELESVAEYVEQFGKGESACLAVAIHRHWVVATDETKDRRLSREIAAKRIQVINTPGILLKAIRQGVLSVQAADLIKEELEANRFKMSFKSFQELIRNADRKRSDMKQWTERDTTGQTNPVRISRRHV
jgi:predicted nucleic acid-binding protein